jgi:hypothetical protein
MGVYGDGVVRPRMLCDQLGILLAAELPNALLNEG